MIRGAWGEEIALVGGNILLSCPGNVFLMPGRSLVSLAEDDINLRAKGSADISATSNDVRIKAHKNLEFLAGTGGAQGRMLFENQASSDQHSYKKRVGEEIDGSAGEEDPGPVLFREMRDIRDISQPGLKSRFVKQQMTLPRRHEAGLVKTL